MKTPISTRALRLLAAALALIGAPAAAQDSFEPYAEVTFKGVHSDRAIADGDSVESSGIGAAADAGFEWKNGRTSVQFDLGASVFDFTDETRSTRDGARAAIAVTQQLSDTVSVTLAASHSDDITVLESREADQNSIRAEVEIAGKSDTIRLRAHYRERRYETGAGGKGEGMRFDGRYNHRFGAWHWARIDVSADDIDSDVPARGYVRHEITASYSLPITKRVRLRPQVEYSRWRYDDRRVPGDPAAERRRDSFIAPEIGLAFGKLDGLNARVRAAYQFRKSNDPRFGKDAPYLEASVGWRF